jgi:hypothetical protein
VLKQRIEEAPEARKRGLKVWFDKDNLRAGEPWQKQLEETIGQQATAFAVYVGSRGVINWVKAEVRLGLARAIGGPGPEASIAKLVSASKLQEIASYGIDLMGMTGAVMDGEIAPMEAWFSGGAPLRPRHAARRRQR